MPVPADPASDPSPAGPAAQEPSPADPASDPSPAGPAAQEPAAGTLARLIAGRLAGSDLDENARALLLTAFQDDGGARGRMPGAYLQSVTVSGFRGIGRTARLPLTPGPGLTLVTSVGGEASGQALVDVVDQERRGGVRSVFVLGCWQ